MRYFSRGIVTSVLIFVGSTQAGWSASISGKFECPNGPSFEIKGNTYHQQGLKSEKISKRLKVESGEIFTLGDGYRFGVWSRGNGVFEWSSGSTGDSFKCRKLNGNTEELPNVINSNCGMGWCSWISILDRTIIERSDADDPYTIMKVNIRSGSSGFHEVDYPSDAASASIEWNEEDYNVIVYCNTRYPAVDFDLEDPNEISTLGVVSPFGYEQDAVNLYVRVCHGLEPFAEANDLYQLGYKDSERKSFRTSDQWKSLLKKTIKNIKMSSIERIFKSVNSDERRYLQESLRTLGFYKSSIDGIWGRGTEAAFRQLFEYLDSYYPDRQYISDFGFGDGQITKKEFVDFWNALSNCNQGKLLSITSMCNR